MFKSMKTKGTVALALMASLVGGANAAVDTTAIEASVIADLGTVTAFAFTILAAYLSLHIGLKLVKKFTNKAT